MIAEKNLGWQQQLLALLAYNQATATYSPSKPVTDRQLLEWGVLFDPNRLELYPDNVLLISPLRETLFSRLNAKILFALSQWNEEKGNGIATESSGGWKLPDGSILTPDAGWLSPEKLYLIENLGGNQFAKTAPDFLIELRSPGDKMIGNTPANLKLKMDIWMASGVRLAWLIDPIEEQAFIYRQGQTTEHIQSFDAILSGEDVLPGFKLELAKLRLPK